MHTAFFWVGVLVVGDGREMIWTWLLNMLYLGMELIGHLFKGSWYMLCKFFSRRVVSVYTYTKRVLWYTFAQTLDKMGAHLILNVSLSVTYLPL